MNIEEVAQNKNQSLMTNYSMASLCPLNDGEEYHILVTVVPLFRFQKCKHGDISSPKEAIIQISNNSDIEYFQFVSVIFTGCRNE
ncbi:hypothetical protein JD844_015568 [Phrynosoma platyrhinos]|uniref:Uncharacterized protein n=1 Tax=Phrynosoma platyrhinos TaxID=52577 RepID=A0ABQ7SJE2_PHRPL|nr:hypothetical protein JD844_015568 [Phrynosoma platyrhinos]